MNNLKDRSLTLRISSDTLNRLSLLEKETNKPVSTLVRQFIETMLYSYEKSKTEMVENSMEAVFEIMDNDNRLINTMEGNLIELKTQIETTLERVSKQKQFKVRKNRNLFTGAVE